jgi:hypothetical protein
MSMISLATVVEWDALLKTVVASFVAGVGITLAFSVSIYGATRTAELRRDERPLAAGLAFAVLVAGLAVSVAGIAFGLVALVSK